MSKQRKPVNRTATRKAGPKVPKIASSRTLPPAKFITAEERAERAMARFFGDDVAAPGYPDVVGYEHALPEAGASSVSDSKRRPRRVRRRVSSENLPWGLYGPARAVRDAQDAYELAATELAERVATARNAGASWRLIGELTAMTGEGARARWGRGRSHRVGDPRPSG